MSQTGGPLGKKSPIIFRKSTLSESCPFEKMGLGGLEILLLSFIPVGGFSQGETLLFHQPEGCPNRQAWHGKTLPEVGGEVSIRHFELLSAASPGAPNIHSLNQKEMDWRSKKVSHDTSWTIKRRYLSLETTRNERVCFFMVMQNLLHHKWLELSTPF